MLICYTLISVLEYHKTSVVSERLSLGVVLDPTPMILRYIVIIDTDDIRSSRQGLHGEVNGSHSDARGQWRNI